jgi:hypothetical protein
VGVLVSVLTCPNCNGAGRVFSEPAPASAWGPHPDEPCAVCDGSGSLPITPDEHGNDFVTFGDGTAAAHAAGQWWLVADEPREVIA